MKIHIKRFDKNLSLPEYKTPGAAAFDITARENVEIPAGEVGYIPLNIAVETPPGYFLLLAARGSTHKKGVILANGIGIGDPDFSGDGDEYKAAYFNFTKNSVLIEKGERISQGMFIRSERVEWEELENMPNKTRGGFGSTGNK